MVLYVPRLQEHGWGPEDAKRKWTEAVLSRTGRLFCHLFTSFLVQGSNSIAAWVVMSNSTFPRKNQQLLSARAME